MKPKPVRRAPLPAYPTRLQVLAEPDLLARHQPPAWLRQAELAGAVAAFLAVNGVVQAGSPAPPIKPDAAAVVAPIFNHGEGRGVAGCVVIAPPVFLSEEEALQVIGEELRKAGVDLSQKKVELAGVKVAPRRYNYQKAGDDWKEELVEDAAGAIPLKVDGQDPERRVAVEFVSEQEYAELGGPLSSSSVQRYDFKDVAQKLATQVGKQGKGIYFGSFYDPGNKIQRDEFSAKGQKSPRQTWDELRASKAAESKERLRAQVKDFVDWLKGQGVI